LIILLILLISLSAYFSIVEISFASVNSIKLKNWAEKGRKEGQQALYIVQNYDKALASILFGNNLVNIGAATISAQIATEIWGAKLGIIISTLTITLLVLIIGDILPKTLAKENPEKFALYTGKSLLIIMKIFNPFSVFLMKIPKLVSKFLGLQREKEGLTEEEIKLMLDLSEKEGNIEKEEKEMAKKILDFNQLPISEIAIKKDKIVGAKVDCSLDEIKAIFNNNSFARIPIYRGDLNNIIGILSARDFLSELAQGKRVDIEALVKKPFFVLHTTNVTEVLQLLKKHKNNIAIVQDGRGNTLGLVTLEDLLEKIVGDIYDLQDDRKTGKEL
jgi:Mg2+/Co2+ transporter CorB